MKTWHSRATVRATPERVIDTLTDTEACGRWSPVPFELDDAQPRRLRPGRSTRVSGRMLGVQVRFELETFAASLRSYVAYAAHIGGFGFGVLAGALSRRRRQVPSFS